MIEILKTIGADISIPILFAFLILVILVAVAVVGYFGYEMFIKDLIPQVIKAVVHR